MVAAEHLSECDILAVDSTALVTLGDSVTKSSKVTKCSAINSLYSKIQPQIDSQEANFIQSKYFILYACSETSADF